MGHNTDEATWARLLGGDARAFGEVWDHHRDRVFRHLIRSGSDIHDAEDLSAVTFLELWRRRGSVRFVDGSLLPWLLVTAHNVHRNHLRARHRYRRFLETLPPPTAAPDPATLLEDADPDRDRRVRAVMAAARPADARLVAMTALEGFTVADAAAAIGIGESAAKMRLSRLRKRLAAASAAAPGGGVGRTPPTGIDPPSRTRLTEGNAS
ncbi:RNA polymerase sigma factor [Plantibacter sp. Mn2098]|uniref:RNA polymerase sigma factor n=1 Tax=Plantibacter sp. Mn2098 TaxID=3395266 RepID=UPI003BDB916B